MEALINNNNNSLYQLLCTRVKDFIQAEQTQQISEASLQKPKINSISTRLYLILTLDVEAINVFAGVSFINSKKIILNCQVL